MERFYYREEANGQYAQFAGLNSAGKIDNHNFKYERGLLGHESMKAGWVQDKQGNWVPPVTFRPSFEGGQHVLVLNGKAVYVKKFKSLLTAWKRQFRQQAKKLRNVLDESKSDAETFKFKNDWRSLSRQQQRQKEKTGATPYTPINYMDQRPPTSNEAGRRRRRASTTTQAKRTTGPLGFSQWRSKKISQLNAMKREIAKKRGEIARIQGEQESEERKVKQMLARRKAEGRRKELSGRPKGSKQRDNAIDKLNRQIDDLEDKLARNEKLLQNAKAPTPTKRPAGSTRDRTEEIAQRGDMMRRRSKPQVCTVCKGTGKKKYYGEKKATTCLRCHGIENWTFWKHHTSYATDSSIASDAQSEVSEVTTWTANGSEAESTSNAALSISSVTNDAWTQHSWMPANVTVAQYTTPVSVAQRERSPSPVTESLPAVPETHQAADVESIATTEVTVSEESSQASFDDVLSQANRVALGSASALHHAVQAMPTPAQSRRDFQALQQEKARLASRGVPARRSPVGTPRRPPRQSRLPMTRDAPSQQSPQQPTQQARSTATVDYEAQMRAKMQAQFQAQMQEKMHAQMQAQQAQMQEMQDKMQEQYERQMNELRRQNLQMQAQINTHRMYNRPAPLMQQPAVPQQGYQGPAASQQYAYPMAAYPATYGQPPQAPTPQVAPQGGRLSFFNQQPPCGSFGLPPPTGR